MGFRIVSHKFVAIGSGPKAITYGKCVGEDGGICHASKEKLWFSLQAFGVRKGSPIHASIIDQLYGSGKIEIFFSLKCIQRDFNMAILWWIATGSNKKMEGDIAFKYTDPSKALWTRRLTQGEIALEVNQFQLQFVVLGSGLILSIVLFLCEVIHG